MADRHAIVVGSAGRLEELASTDYLNDPVAKLRETSGPNVLTLGSIADGELLIRSGSTVIGTSKMDMLATMVNSEVSVTGATTLTSSAFGKWHNCSGSSDYTVTLPSASSNGGKFIGLRTTGTNQITVDAGSGVTISGYRYRRYWGAGRESVILACDGTNWWIVDQCLRPVAIDASISGVQTITSATTTTVQLATDVYDDDGLFDTANYRFTAPVKDYYHFSCRCGFYEGGAGTYTATHYMYRRINAGSDSAFVSCNQAAINSFVMNGSFMVQLAKGDYVDLRVWHDRGSNVSLTVGRMVVQRLFYNGSTA